MASTANCTHMTPECPVKATPYGYYPNLGVTVFFTALFGTLLVLQLVIGIWKNTFSYMAWVSVGCFGEFLGYIGRLLMHQNPWNQAGLEIQICCFVLAPSFLAAGIYLTLKHATFTAGESTVESTRDVIRGSLLAVGGGVAAASGSSGNVDLANAGNDLILAGIAMQIFSMLVFGVLAINYYQCRKKAQRKTSMPPIESSDTEKSMISRPGRDDETRIRDNKHIIVFCNAMCFAYVTILIRCIYRIHEMAGGWGNPRMRDELLFLILDGMMIGLASFAVTVAHPGFLFPPWRVRKTASATNLA